MSVVIDHLSAFVRAFDSETDIESALWSDIASVICSSHGIPTGGIARTPRSDHVVFLIGDELVLKIYIPGRACFERERSALELFGPVSPFPIPSIVHVGQFEGLGYIVMTQLAGSALSRSEFLALTADEQFAIATQLAAGLKQMHEIGQKPDHCDWPEFVAGRAESFIERQINLGVNDTIIAELPAFIDANLASAPLQPTVLLHGDVHFGNLRFQNAGGNWRISGLFDFADSRCAFYEYDFLAVGVLMLQGTGDLQREFFRAYGYADHELDEAMRHRLMMLTMLYETSDLRRYALRLRPDAADLSLEELERSIWNFI